MCLYRHRENIIRGSARKPITGPDPAKPPFLISTDALNYWRIVWRCSTEWGMRGLNEALAAEIRSAVCASRGYEEDDFDSAIQATRGRARLPFGWTALDLSWKLSQNEPIRLLDPQLA